MHACMHACFVYFSPTDVCCMKSENYISFQSIIYITSTYPRTSTVLYRLNSSAPRQVSHLGLLPLPPKTFSNCETKKEDLGPPSQRRACIHRVRRKLDVQVYAKMAAMISYVQKPKTQNTRKCNGGSGWVVNGKPRGNYSSKASIQFQSRSRSWF